MTGCYIQTKTRKPESDLKTKTQTVSAINECIHVDTIIIKKIDTSLNLFKAEALVGITVKGKFHTPMSSATITYFDNVTFVESSNLNDKHIRVDIVPHMKTSLLSKKAEEIQHKIKYKSLSNGDIAFEFYVEKKIITPHIGACYQIGFICGAKSNTILLFRGK
ncbi:MAG TPA: hypothetical protein VK796_11445 [Cytophaga sp.]|nr:hypothetical protein [Cytophaga sp.]